MLDQILKTTIEELNNFLHRKYAIQESVVITSNLVNQDGTIPEENQNKIICSIVNIEQERELANQVRRPGMVLKAPPVHLTISLMFSSTYTNKNYLEGLKLLSNLMGFFQGKAVFTPQNTPGLPKDIRKITFDMYTLTFEQLNHLWGSQGAKYMPSVVYNVRGISVSEDQILEEVGTIKVVETKSPNS